MEQRRDGIDQEIRKTIAKLQDREQEIMLADGNLNYSNKDLVDLSAEKSMFEQRIAAL